MFPLKRLIEAYEKAVKEREAAPIGDNDAFLAHQRAAEAVVARVDELRNRIPTFTGSIWDVEVMAELAYFSTWESLRSFRTTGFPR